MAMKKILLVATITLVYCSTAKSVLPINKECNPDTHTCYKGDWVDEDIAHCKYEKEWPHLLSCDAQFADDTPSWTVDVAKGDRCKPVDGKSFLCGAPGTSTRCVCSDTNVAYSLWNSGNIRNECKCQYWPKEDSRALQPAFCTGYYTGGETNVHHWACCNNTNTDQEANSCDRTTWQGGSKTIYCNSEGKRTPKAGGIDKYYFNCVGCDTQKYCVSLCSDEKYKTLPGLCWKWLDCFKNCCLRATADVAAAVKLQLHGANVVKAFCGDGSCGGDETPSSCPIDCCYKANKICTITDQSCTPSCCGDSNCCLPIEKVEVESSVSKIIIAVGVVIVTVFAIIKSG